MYLHFLFLIVKFNNLKVWWCNFTDESGCESRPSSASILKRHWRLTQRDRASLLARSKSAVLALIVIMHFACFEKWIRNIGTLCVAPFLFSIILWDLSISFFVQLNFWDLPMLLRVAFKKWYSNISLCEHVTTYYTLYCWWMFMLLIPFSDYA